MGLLPQFNAKTQVNDSPHVVVLGAGASRAAFPKGDALGRKLPVMNDLIDVLDLRKKIELADIPISQNFEEIYDSLISSGKHPAIVVEIENKVRAYFEAMRLPDTPTIYDYLILSLRKKDLIASFNWDPLLIQAFRRNSQVCDLPTILFLHGNVEIGSCLEDRRVGFHDQSCSACLRPFKPTPLLFPVKRKDYNTDPFIRSEWDTLSGYLERAYFLSVFGYSAPTTDAEAKALMQKAWAQNQSRTLSETEIIDVKERTELEATWEPFIHNDHRVIANDIFKGYLFHHPRRSCDELAMRTLQCQRWKSNPFPTFSTLSDLHRWIEPLLEEERRGTFSGEPCPR